ncbi:MAG: HEAT repeat domain-containing protein [Pseudomonadota bacterium]
MNKLKWEKRLKLVLKFISRFYAYIAIPLAFLCLIPFFFILVDQESYHLFKFFFYHILSSVLFASGMYFLTKKFIVLSQKNNLWWIYALISCLAMPIAGLVSVFTIYIFQRLQKTRPPPIITDEISVQEAAVFGRKKLRLKQLEILDRLDIEPFIDIFQRGHSELKKSAVMILSNIRTYKAVQTLKVALLDEDIEVRLFAAGILGKIEDEFAIAIKGKTSLFEENPHDQMLAQDLAKLYVAYAESGLLDEIGKKYYYTEALAMLDKTVTDIKINFLKSKILLSIDNLDAAQKEIEKCLSVEPHNSVYNEQLWEVLFAKKDFAELSSRTQKRFKEGSGDFEREVVSFWT